MAKLNKRTRLMASVFNPETKRTSKLYIDLENQQHIFRVYFEGKVVEETAHPGLTVRDRMAVCRLVHDQEQVGNFTWH